MGQVGYSYILGGFECHAEVWLSPPISEMVKFIPHHFHLLLDRPLMKGVVREQIFAFGWFSVLGGTSFYWIKSVSL